MKKPTPIADMVEAMLSAGVAPRLILLAIRTVESAGRPIDPVAEKRRAWDRARKTRKRRKAAK